MMSTPARSACSCGPMLTPPNTAKAVTGVCTAIPSMWAWIWTASSRVGVRTRARVVRRGLCRSRCTMGRPKAAVLPLPVAAQARTSRPSRAGGMAWSWMGVGLVKPSSLTPRSSKGSRPNDEKGTSGPGVGKRGTALAFGDALRLGLAVLREVGGGEHEAGTRHRLGLAQDLALQLREAEVGRVLEPRLPGGEGRVQDHEDEHPRISVAVHPQGVLTPLARGLEPHVADGRG